MLCVDCRAFGLPPYIPVPEQISPDPDFPTVKFPNPEEGAGALSLSFRTADAHSQSATQTKHVRWTPTHHTPTSHHCYVGY